MPSTAPTPFFRLPPLLPRLSDEEIVHAARVLNPGLVDPNDPRVQDEPRALFAITCESRATLALEWPDGTLAHAALRAGATAHHALEEALRAAYARGRDRLELIHLHAQPALPAGVVLAS